MSLGCGCRAGSDFWVFKVYPGGDSGTEGGGTRFMWQVDSRLRWLEFETFILPVTWDISQGLCLSGSSIT